MTTPLNVDTVLFDVDGTLIDSTYHHTMAWARAFARVELTPALFRVHRLIGMGGDQLVPEIAGDRVEERFGEQLRTYWEEEYRKLVGEVRAFEGAAETVRAVRDRGYRVALASSGKEEFTEIALERLGLSRDELDAVTSSDDADASKPEPEILQVALHKAGGTKAVLVGDATWDAVSAGRGGMSSIGLCTGGFSIAELTDAGAALVVETIADLRDHQALPGRS